VEASHRKSLLHSWRLTNIQYEKESEDFISLFSAVAIQPGHVIPELQKIMARQSACKLRKYACRPKIIISYAGFSCLPIFVSSIFGATL